MSRPLPTSSSRKRGLILALALLSLFGLALVFQRNLESLESPVEKDNPLLYLPSGKYLKIVSMGYDNLLADLIYLWSIQYYGDYELYDRYPYLERIFDVITDIDPRFVDAYDFGSMIMVMDADKTEKALALLEKGIENNRNAWNLASWAGFICFIHKNPPDYEKAAFYFERAESMEGCPPLVRRLRPLVLKEIGDIETAYRIFEQEYGRAEDEYSKRVIGMHMRDLRLCLDTAFLKWRLERFRQETGLKPASWDQLIRAGLLPETPLDPDGEAYLYDPATNEVVSKGGFSYGRKRMLVCEPEILTIVREEKKKGELRPREEK